MKTFHFFAWVLYDYIGQRVGTPYFRTLTILTFILSLNLMTILGWVSLFDLFPGIEPANGKYFLQLLVEWLPLFFLLRILIKEKKMEELDEKYRNDWDRIYKGRVFLIFYSILSFALLIIVAIWKDAH